MTKLTQEPGKKAYNMLIIRNPSKVDTKIRRSEAL